MDSQLILAHFQKNDPILYASAIKFDSEQLFAFDTHTNYFERLCRAIAGQQLSTKAASTIWGRFVALLPKGELTAENILKLEHEEMRGAGLSNAKANYIRGIAQAVVDKQIDFEALPALSDEQVITELTKLKGVGIWTAEMFLMFTLHRPDLFSTGDLGLKRAIERLYGLENPSAEAMLELARKWSPYRTFACRVLWESLDNNPTN